MGMKPVKNRSRAIFEEVGVETPKQMPVAPKGGMIDARPKGARKALMFWMVSLIVLAVLQLGLDATPGFGIAELELVQPYTGLALFAAWALGALGLAVSRRLPPGWGMRVAGLGLGCLLLAASDPAPMSQLSKALSPAPAAEVLPQTGALPPLQLLPATPPTPAPVVAPPTPQERVVQAANLVVAQIERAQTTLGAAPFATLRLGLAFALAGFAFWYALLAARTEAALISARRQAEPGLVGLATGLMHLSFLQLLVGGLVTGLGAGAVFSDWPLMGGLWLPPDMLSLQPIWRNALENQALLQFSHRALGYLLVVLALVALIRSRRSVHAVTRTAFVLAAVWMLLQAVLGVVTLLHGDPLALRLAHLGGALVLWLFLIRARFLARYPRVQSIRGIK
ncbi:COX15/CtaA family protein [Rhodobacter capsulatus]|uniref:Cytochrome c oxidase assembly protein subunit 15 n=1 Tax=Rhodobacter capsulatus TaxID=1061 RepID=A0A1G7JIU5_RHOCA|nr:COX15/CtaA family protein [Rhodobacter capsulatus]WER07850.1 COX15/CtaA family protein [Rhodobacter capsulatus]SDF24785.1 cytochrome c oxidase assembly protein subunit 15 [Rhodobacter capsulatus]